MWFGSDLQKSDFMWVIAVHTSWNHSEYNLEMPKIRFWVVSLNKARVRAFFLEADMCICSLHPIHIQCHQQGRSARQRKAPPPPSTSSFSPMFLSIHASVAFGLKIELCLQYITGLRGFVVPSVMCVYVCVWLKCKGCSLAGQRYHSQTRNQMFSDLPTVTMYSLFLHSSLFRGSCY